MVNASLIALLVTLIVVTITTILLRRRHRPSARSPLSPRPPAPLEGYQPQSSLSQLPVDVQLLVLSFLPVEDLCGGVSPASRWCHSLCLQNSLWESLYKRDSRFLWPCIQKSSALRPSCWLDLYRENHAARLSFHAPTAHPVDHRADTIAPRRFPGSGNRGFLSRMLWSSPSRRGDLWEGFVMVPSFGAIRSIFYQLYHLSSQDTPVTRTGTFPGSQDVGSSVGLRSAGREVLLCAMHGWHESGLEKMWAVRRPYLQRANGLLFVVKKHPSAEWVTEAANLLHHAAEQSRRGQESGLPAPLLVLVRNDAEMTPSDVCQGLRLLESWHGPWRVQAMDSLKLTGLAQGISWLLDHCHPSHMSTPDDAKTYADNRPKCAALHEEAKGIFAASGSTHVNRRFQPFRPYVSRASGSQKWDEDGNQYVDYTMGHGALLLGHSHPQVTAAIAEQAGRGTLYGDNSALELSWARQVREIMPRAERVEPTACGQEANMLAIRLAQLHTGRTKILRFRENFHGWCDTVTLDQRFCDPRVSSTFVEPWDLEAVVRELSSKTYAAVLIEGGGCHLAGQLPVEPEFVKSLAQEARKNGSLFVLDEVVTGFREVPGGFQEVIGVAPDLFTLGKIVGGGVAMGAVGGRADVMSCLSKFSKTGTWNGNALACAAGLATLKLASTGEHQRLANQAATRLITQVNSALRSKGLHRRARLYARAGSIVHTLFSEHEGSVDVDTDAPTRPQSLDPRVVFSSYSAARQDRLCLSLLNSGVSTLGGRVLILSSAHSDDDVDATARAVVSGMESALRD